jgi:hypothetical protein
MESTSQPKLIRVVDFLAVCIQLAEYSGKIIRELAESGRYK